MSSGRVKFNVAEMVVMAMMSTLAFVLKEAMAFLPNIEPVSLFMMLAGALFGIKGMLCGVVFALLECLIYGFGPWQVIYFVVWPLLALIAAALRRFRNPIIWAVVSGLYGLSFGIFFLPNAIFLFGYNTPEKILSYLAYDLPFNLTHAAGNFVIALVLFVPLRKACERVLKKR